MTLPSLQPLSLIHKCSNWDPWGEVCHSSWDWPIWEKVPNVQCVSCRELLTYVNINNKHWVSTNCASPTPYNVEFVYWPSIFDTLFCVWVYMFFHSLESSSFITLKIGSMQLTWNESPYYLGWRFFHDALMIYIILPFIKL